MDSLDSLSLHSFCCDTARTTWHLIAWMYKRHLPDHHGSLPSWARRKSWLVTSARLSVQRPALFNQGIKPKALKKTSVSWKTTIKRPKDYEKDKMGKYAPYFKDNIILPIPGISDLLEPRILSLVVVDLKDRKLVGLTKEVFEELLQTADISAQYFCRGSFATWDVQLPTKEQAAKLAESGITTKFFRLQPEYMGARRIRVTVCNVPANLTEDVVASFLSSYGKVEDVTQVRAATGAARWDYVFRICLNWEDFQSIPNTINSRDR